MIKWSKTTIPVAATGIFYTSGRMEDIGNPLFANELSIHSTTKFNNTQNSKMVKSVRASERKHMTQRGFVELFQTAKHSISGNINIIST
jgi:hypothetical protein